MLTASRNDEPRCAADSPTEAQCYVVRGNPFTSNPSQPTNPVNPPYGKLNTFATVVSFNKT